jgi:SAM-dependent methyltransferase
MSYIWDDQHGLFWRENARTIQYTDGQDVESGLDAIIGSALDRSVSSTELARQVADWPTEYHLSKLRHCLLRPLNIKRGDRVLEIGCGCGALTRYLGEIGADTVALEGSPARARIASARCSGLPNVRVYVDNLLDLDLAGSFDWVLMVGVLEYAPVYVEGGEEPLNSYLGCATRYLSPGGKLVIAIENKLGLKYWNGCSEDHLGKRYVGIEGLYRAGQPVTLGKRELIELLKKAGFESTRFYYPYPDYKLPSVILTESGLNSPDFDVADLLARAHARDYTGLQYRNFDDALVLDQLAKNGLLGELSNSFLIVAGLGLDVPGDDSALAFVFSADRVPEFAMVTTLRRTEGNITVSKEAMFQVSQRVRRFSSGLVVRNVPGETPYMYGRQVLWPILKSRAESGTRLPPLAELFRPWFEYLLRLASVEFGANVSNCGRRLADIVVPFELFDCTPFNVIENDGSLYLIDKEWSADRPVALGWIVTRGVMWSLAVGVPVADRLQPLAEVINELCASVGLLVTTADIQQWTEEEATFQTDVTGRHSSPLSVLLSSGGLRRIQAGIDHPSESSTSWEEERRQLRTQLEDARAKIAALTAEARAQNAALQRATQEREYSRMYRVEMSRIRVKSEQERRQTLLQLADARVKISALSSQMQARDATLQRARQEVGRPKISPGEIPQNCAQSEEERRQLFLHLEDARAKISALTAEKHALAGELQSAREGMEYAEGELQNRSTEFAARLEQVWKERAAALLRLEQSAARAARIDADARTSGGE